MRISKQAKQQTDSRILKAAEKLFLSKGYEDTTTRDIASSAGIATGTLFNYYKTKESLAMRLVYNAMLQGQEDFTGRTSGEEEIGEEIFMIMTGELRHHCGDRPVTLLPLHFHTGRFQTKIRDPLGQPE